MNRTPALVFLLLAGCSASSPSGIARAPSAKTTVRMDFLHKPLPEIPLPNDLATRYDPSSPTHRRVNVSMIAPTTFESRTRARIDDLDGFGVFQEISIPFTGPIDVASLIAGHRDVHYETNNDVIYLINVDRRSPSFGKIHPLDVGNGNFPVVLKKTDNYWKNDLRDWELSLAVEELDESDTGDIDGDGLISRPNYLPGLRPARDDLAGRADALMSFYDDATHTVWVRPVVPLDGRTTYAVVVTRRLLDASGEPVGSPYAFVNHTDQTPALEPLLEVMPEGVTPKDIAFAFTFTTQTIDEEWVAVRDGLYGHGVQAHLGQAYPAEVKGLFPLRDPKVFPNMKNPHLLYTENWLDAQDLISQALGGAVDGYTFKVIKASHSYVDYHVIGWFESPQLFPRWDGACTERMKPRGAKIRSDGKLELIDGTVADPDWHCLVPLTEEVWPENLDRIPAVPRTERVYFWLSVPRKESSKRGQGKPADVVIVGHGYTGSKFEGVGYAGFLARRGLAMLAIDCPSHGLSANPIFAAALKGMLEPRGLAPFVEAALHNRDIDWDNDSLRTPDSGADMWTAYALHTRDMVRQAAVDYMQLIRIFRSFDGTRRFSFDVDGSGTPALAGDFDGDGQVDVGGPDAIFAMTGASLGGIMSMVMGSLEPRLNAVVPISGGGGMGDIGMRSWQAGVPEAVFLRIMGPIYVGSIDKSSGQMRVQTIVPNLYDINLHDGSVPDGGSIALVDGVAPGDTMVVENLIGQKRGCGLVTPEGKVRATVASNLQDRTRISFYHGRALLAGSTECEVEAGASPFRVIDTFELPISFQGTDYPEGSPLLAIAEGMGLRRQTPDLRRFIGAAQLVLDPTDPAVVGRHLIQKPLLYPGTGEETGTHSIVVTTVGDMNVPASTGVAFGRAAGLIPYLEDEPRFGKPANQMLIDARIVEAVNTLKRYTSPSGDGVHPDIENFSQGTDLWGKDIPRAGDPQLSAIGLKEPFHLGLKSRDRLGGISAAIFPLGRPEGQHGFDQPGQETQEARDRCKASCNGPSCSCDTVTTFDTGIFMLNVLSRYMASGGTVWSPDLCNAHDDCADLPPTPALRDLSMMP